MDIHSLTPKLPTKSNVISVMHKNALFDILINERTSIAELESTLFAIADMRAENNLRVYLKSSCDSPYFGSPVKPYVLHIAQGELDNVESLAKTIQTIKDKFLAMDMDKLAVADFTKKSKPFDEPYHERYQFSPTIKQSLKSPQFNNWEWDENELKALLFQMYDDLGLIEAFQIDKKILRNFLNTSQECYNSNPFHNFKHAFCVSQMVFTANLVLCNY
jgi:hypothetical protein